MKKVSVIIPVYNVEKYVSQCLESICNQTYEKLEILIIYDKCQDKSLEICKEWEKRDSRVKVIVNESRCGLGAARNIGLKLATGEYIVYLDADDWCIPEYVMRLVETLEKTHADYVSYAGMYMDTTDGMLFSHYIPAGSYLTDEEKEIVYLRDIEVVWKRIYRKDWLLSEHLHQPEVFALEDWGYNIPLVLSCNNIQVISGAGVYYRVTNENSLVNSMSDTHKIQNYANVLQYAITKLKKRGLLEKYKWVVYIDIFTVYISLIKKAKNKVLEENIKILENSKEYFLKELQLPQLLYSKKNIAFGSFATMWIMKNAGIFLESLDYYGFTSIISAMSKGITSTISHKNPFRQEQVQKDIEGNFLTRIQSVNEPTVIFMDFLNEQNDILCGDTYIFDSEAYQECEFDNNPKYRRISSDSEEYFNIWKSKCNELVELLLEKKEYIQLYLIRSRMSLRYGNLNETHSFGDVEKLDKINQRVFGLEEYFISQCNKRNVGIVVTDMPEKYMFTDEEFRHGCEPQYMNELLYTYIGLDIAKKWLNTELQKAEETEK